MAERGVAALHAELATLAPERAAAIEPTDRSASCARSSCTRWASWSELRRPALDRRDARADAGCSAWSRERDDLYARIDARVDAMVAAGAADEVRAADAAGASRTARAALGFSELLAGDVDAMKARTRRYAKRQLTWMRKLAGVELVDVTGRDAREVADRSPRRCSSQTGRLGKTLGGSRVETPCLLRQGR